MRFLLPPGRTARTLLQHRGHLADVLLARLPRALRHPGASTPAQRTGGALVLAALGGVLAYAALARRAALAAARLQHPEAPVIVWEG